MLRGWPAVTQEDALPRTAPASAPLVAVRRFCRACQGDAAGVRDCVDTLCPLHPWRKAALPGGTRPADMRTPQQALRAIRRQCMACAGSRSETRACKAKAECPLWHFRFGVRPATYRAVRQRFFGPKPLRLL